MSTRNRYRNRLGVSAITAILIVVASLAFAGLGVVVRKNRVRVLGDQQRALENDIHILETEILHLNNRIETLLTRDRVQPRLTNASTLLRPITKHSLFVLKALSPQAVAHESPVSSPSLAQTTPRNP